MKLTKKKKKRYSLWKIFTNGVIFENPVMVQLLGMCPALAVSTTLQNAIGMGLSATFVLIFSNILISILRKFIPEKIRIAAYIVIIAGFVSIIDMVLVAFLPALSASLGLFIPLIVVNCIIFARAESFASKNSVIPSAVDGLACGLGFTLALMLVSVFREVLGNGTIWGISIFGDAFPPAILVAAPFGGFLFLGIVIALFQFVLGKFKKDERGDE